MIQSTQRETGNRNECCGCDSFWVTGDGHGSQPFGDQPLSLQPSEPRCQLPPVLVPSGPRILELCPSQSSGLPMLPPLSSASHYTPYSILAHSLLHFCTRHRRICTFARYLWLFPSLDPSASLLVNVSPCQHAPSRKRVSPCHRAHVPPLGALRQVVPSK
jgi:hypothetical protein